MFAIALRLHVNHCNDRFSFAALVSARASVAAGDRFLFIKITSGL